MGNQCTNCKPDCTFNQICCGQEYQASQKVLEKVDDAQTANCVQTDPIKYVFKMQKIPINDKEHFTKGPVILESGAVYEGQ